MLQKELTGRIALGLLSETPENGHAPIYVATLKRIQHDFNRVHRMRNWLRDTRKEIDRFQGIGQGTGPSSKSVRAVHSESEQPDLIVRPSIFLRHSGAGKWAVAMEVPNFEPVIDKLGADLRQFLKRTRCRLAGAPDFKPGGWTLAGSRTGILKSWPDQEESLLAFEAPHKRLDQILQAECRIPPGLSWLFRLGADGRGRHITGLNVRPGVSYILVSTEEFPASSDASDAFLTPCEVECSGVQAVRIRMPECPSDENRSRLKEFGLEVARTVRVWPAGLPCRNWDGEGQSEWLTTEKPQFGFMPDHPVASYSVCLDGGKEMQFEAPATGEPAFIQLDPLPLGMHHLVITAQRTAAVEGDKELLTGYVDLKVRVPQPWKPGRPEHAGFTVTQDPFEDDLDQLWANAINIAISGPESRKVTCNLSLENSRGDQIISKQICAPRKIPVQPDAWRHLFRQFLNELKKEKKGTYWDYLAAPSGILRIQAEELGEYVLRFHRDTAPVRWIAYRHHGAMKLRLVDEAGLNDEAACEFYSMDHPTKSEPLQLSKALTGFSPKPPGGLFTVRHGEHRDAIIVSVLATGARLGDLRPTPLFKDIEGGKTLIPSALHILTRWHKARAASDIVGGREHIIRKIHGAIYKKLCGPNWADAEVNFLERKDSFHIKTLQKHIDRNGGFAAALEKACVERQKGGGDMIQWYAGLAHRHGVSKDREICEFAARLAFEPHKVSEKYTDKPNDFWHRALSNTEALRGARYASLRLDLAENDRDETQTGRP